MKKLTNQPAIQTRQFKRLDFIRESPQVAAIVNKIVPKGNESDNDREKRLKTNMPSSLILLQASQEVFQNSHDAEMIFSIIPEMELIMQILVSSILSPKDLSMPELTFVNNESELPPTLTAKLLEINKKYMNDYKINRLLSDILEQCLFKTGSFPIAVIPESSIDKAINSDKRVTMESISDNFNADGSLISYGFLGPVVKQETKVSVGLEDYFKSDKLPAGIIDPKVKHEDVDYGIEVYDNYQMLKMSSLKRRLAEQKIQDRIALKSALNVGMESFDQTVLNDQKIMGAFYSKPKTKYESVMRLETPDENDRPTIGHPLTMKLPPESCIPIHVPGNPKDHLAYYIILDETGNPITNESSVDYYRQMSMSLSNAGNTMATKLIRDVDAGFNGLSEFEIKLRFQEALANYTNIVENDLMKRLQHGVYGNNVQISRSNEIYRVMFARTLLNKQTRILFIPKDLLTYFAFDYNKDGIGISLTYKNKILASHRAVLLFSNTMGSIKNSIGRTHVEITLDPKDKDPTGTVEFMMHQYAAHRRTMFPIGSYNPNDIFDYLCNAGVELAVTGNPGYPETKFEASGAQNSYVKPDTELEESLKKRFIQGFGLAPETVELSLGADFAASVVTNNLLLAKRVLVYQQDFTEQLSDFNMKFVLHSGTIRQEYKEVIEENRGELKEHLQKLSFNQIIHQFVKTTKLVLPAPDSLTLQNKMEAFDKYKTALESVIDAYISTEFLTNENLGDLANSVDQTKAALKAHYLRQWLAENNVLAEVAEITMAKTSDDKEEQFSLFDIMDNHVEALSKALKPYMDKIAKRASQYGGGDAGSGGYGGDDNDQTNSDQSVDDQGGDTDGGGDDDFGGMGGDDLGMGDEGDGTGGETPEEDGTDTGTTDTGETEPTSTEAEPNPEDTGSQEEPEVPEEPEKEEPKPAEEEPVEDKDKESTDADNQKTDKGSEEETDEEKKAREAQEKKDQEEQEKKDLAEKEKAEKEKKEAEEKAAKEKEEADKKKRPH